MNTGGGGVYINLTDIFSFAESTSSPNSTKGKSKSSLSLILGITLTGVFIVACTFIVVYVCRRKIAIKQGRNSFH